MYNFNFFKMIILVLIFAEKLESKVRKSGKNGKAQRPRLLSLGVPV